MAEPKIKTKQFIYRNSLKWQGQKRGLLSSAGKPDIEIATPPEFKGHPGIWTPEDLFVASVNSCIMTTFLHFADKQGLEFLGYESDAVGVLEKVENKFTPPLRTGAGLMISMIEIKPKIFLKQDADIQEVEKLIELCERNCLISNSIKSKVKVTPEIKIGV